MSTLNVAGREIALDKDGYLLDLQDWSHPVAEALAAAEDLQLSEEHWEILDLLRAFYAEFQLSPANRPLIKYVALKLGPEKGNSLHLNRLFKGTPAKLAAKLAGLPKPTNCLWTWSPPPNIPSPTSGVFSPRASPARGGAARS